MNITDTGIIMMLDLLEVDNDHTVFILVSPQFLDSHLKLIESFV